MTHHNVGEHNPNAKITWADVCEMRRQYAEGVDWRLISSQYPVTPYHVKAIVEGKRWRRGPGTKAGGSLAKREAYRPRAKKLRKQRYAERRARSVCVCCEDPSYGYAYCEDCREYRRLSEKLRGGR